MYTVDWDEQFKPSLRADIGTLTAEEIINLCGGVPDIIWASPDCTTYSVAAISKHRKKQENGNLTPMTDYAKRCDEINEHLIELIKELKPKYWFIENPVGGLRKMDFMKELPRHTVTYCQYGERRQSLQIFGLTTQTQNSNRLAIGETLATNPRHAEQGREHKDSKTE